MQNISKIKSKTSNFFSGLLSKRPLKFCGRFNLIFKFSMAEMMENLRRLIERKMYFIFMVLITLTGMESFRKRYAILRKSLHSWKTGYRCGLVTAAGSLTYCSGEIGSFEPNYLFEKR